jgi:hypothetical protein
MLLRIPPASSGLFICFASDGFGLFFRHLFLSRRGGLLMLTDGRHGSRCAL